VYFAAGPHMVSHLVLIGSQSQSTGGFFVAVEDSNPK
jgi:hypothetical protein